MIQLEDFLQLATDDFYKINIYYTNTGVEITHQLSISDTIDYLQENDDLIDLLLCDVVSWDINEDNQLTLNIG